MLINLSNHNVKEWQEEQLRQGKELYGEIVDMPFPAIDPHGDEQYIKKLAKEYLIQILEKKPSAVHIQGEFTFTYCLVTLLKQNNIKCIASTTERVVKYNEDGSRTYYFKFVRFREYV